MLEAVFIALMQHQMSKGTLLAALIGYRAIYFLLPLAIACVVYLVLERRAKQIRKRDWAHEGDAYRCRGDFSRPAMRRIAVGWRRA